MVAIFAGAGAGLNRGSTMVLGSQGQIGDASLGRSGLNAYVNAATGGLNLEVVDEILIGRGADEIVKTEYDSAITTAQNWFLSPVNAVFNLTGTVNTAGSTITHVTEFNDWQVFTYDTGRGDYVFKAGAGAYDEIRYTGGTWSFTDGDTQRVDYYEHAGTGGISYISRRVDTDGNTQSYSYDSNHCISRITNADGSYTDIEGYAAYKPGDVKTTYVNAQGVTTSLTRVRYSWDSSGRLLSSTVDLSPGDNSIADGNIYVTNYTYDGTSQRVASIIQTDGSRLDITYDGSGRVSTYTQTISAGVVRTTSFDYSVAGRTIVTDPAGQKTILFYDSNKNLTQISYPPADMNTNPRVVQFAYNANGDVTSVVHGPGDATTYEYDGNGNRTLERDGAGNTIRRTYGSKNELLTETRYLVPDPDGAGSGQPSTPLTTRYAYDGENHLRYVVSAEGYVTRYDYDAPGQQVAAIEYTGNAFSLAGYAENVSIAESTLDGWSNGLADKSLARRTETAYDYRGNISAETSYSKLLSSGAFDTSSEPSQTTYTYDSYGNLLSRQVYGSTGSEVFVYDGLGRLTQSTDFNGNVTRSYFLDANGQTVITHANGLSEISTYDKAGELIAHAESNAGANLVYLADWPANPGNVPSGQAIVPGWMNPWPFTDETQWASTAGPDGLPVVAMRAGQFDGTDEGGGNYTNQVTIDPTKAYEFTYYFKLSDRDKHNVYFGLSASTPAYVENVANGVDDGNPYFFVAAAAGQSTIFAADTWYKVVAYVLPQGASAPATPLGGVYDVATGQKIQDVWSTYRWNAERPDNSIHSRFFDFYGATSGYSTYFYQPGIRQVSTPAATGPDISTSLYRFDNLGRLRMTVDPTGRRAYMMYDSVGRKAADIDADGSVTEYRYDGNDNVTSTTRYATRLNSTQLASLVDANGNPTNASFASLRPAASADDQWTFQVYDLAQRLVQTIDGTGATTVLAYDGASRVTSTTTYANRLDAGTLAGLKALAVNPNRWNLEANGQPSYTYNLSVAGAGTIDGANAFQMTVGAATDWQAIWTSGMTVTAGQAVTATISLKAVGSTTMDSFGLYGAITGWGADADGSAVIASGPGQITYQYGGFFQVSGLSATEATRITITRTYHQSEWSGPYFYLGSSAIVAGQSTIVSGAVYTSAASPPILPTANATDDRVSRSFYDADGRVIATMDAAGGLSQIVYDKAGRKIRELGSAKAVTQSLRAAGTLAQMIADVGTSASDRRADYVYDARGFLRYMLDATAHPVKYGYDGSGRVIRTVEYPGSITPASSYTVDYVASQATALGLDTSAAKRVSRTVYDNKGQAAFTIDSMGAVTALSYDNVGNVTKQVGYATLYGTFTDDPSLATMQSWAASHAAESDNRVGRTVYDVHGRTAYTVDGEGFVVEHRYDAAGRVIKDISYADVYSVGDGVTKESLAAQIGGLPSTAAVVTYAYDSDGLLSDVTDGVGAVTHYAYDALGQVTDVTAAYGTGDASTTHRTYDTTGRVLSETRGYGTAVAATAYYAYDAVGNAVSVTDARGFVTTRTFDSVGRVLTVRVPVDASSGNDLFTTNQYDAFGDLVKVIDPRGYSSFNYYDSLGRVTLQSDAEGYITQTSYNAFGEVYQVTRRAARGSGTPTVTAPPAVVTGAGDAATTFTYDNRGQVKTSTDAEGYVEQYWYNAFGQRSQIVNKTNGVSQYYYDRRGQIRYEWVDTIAYLASGTAASNGFYSGIHLYDFAGREVQKVEAYGLTERRDTLYTYDKAGRPTIVSQGPVQVLGSDLTTVTTYAPYEVYSYDLRGDLVQRVDAGGGRTLSWYDALGRKTDEVSAVGTLSHWTYDGNGNVLTARVYGDAVAIPGTPGGTPPAPVNSGNYRETSYSYDRANRLIATTIAGLKFGVDSGGTYVTTYSGSVSTQAVYDKAGNVIGQIDGIGNAAWTYYDGLGRKIAQVDRENYLTYWTLDANGNALSETRYANKIGSYVDYSTPVGSLLAAAGTNAADRTTTFTYDRNGRRLTETRQSVASASVAGNGALSTATQNATITYTYNGLGLVTSKTEANGDLTTYIYDTSGRLMTTKGAAFTDNMGTVIRPQTDFYYDGLGDLVRTVQHGDVYAYAADRVTTSSYGAGGRLLSSTDAGSFVRNYGYDLNGRLLKESWTRVKSDGSSVSEAMTYRYDLAGRLVTQAAATWNGSAFVFGDATRIRYDAYGEVTGRGITAGPNDTAAYQEMMDYDAGGRVWRTTAGDGTFKFIFYDKAGNATLTLSSTGADLTGLSYDSAMASLTAAGGTNIANAVTTVSVFDKRGLQTQSREPGRQLTASTSATLINSRAYDAFGEVTSETDARGYTTTFSYNAMGRLTQKVSPIVNWTGEDGTVHTTDHPTENYYYDVSGRLVGVRDANNNLTTRQLENGSGHDGGDPLVHAEFHADGGSTVTWHNVFGDERVLVDELGHWEVRGYDNMGRVVEVDHRGGLLVDYYSYDGLGQRTRHVNNQFGSSIAERTDYDVQGRVTAQTDFAGGVTSYAYSWVSTLGTTGIGNFGGWQKSTTDPTSHTAYEYNDYFGRVVCKINYSGQLLSYGFDLGGRLTWETNSAGQTMNDYWFNTGNLYQIVDTAGSGKNVITSTYGYDEAGNRTYEGHAGTVYSYYYPSGTTASSLTLENSTIAYDALGRMTSITDRDAAGTTRVTIANQYDLAGNVRRTNTTYPNIAYPQYGSISEDKWFRYDSMNRMVVADGQLVSGQIVRGGFGEDVSYDAAGRRATQTKDAALTGYAMTWVWYPDYDPNGPGWHDFAPMEPGVTGDYQYQPTNYMGARQEQYAYRDDGELSTVRFAETGYTDNGDGTVSSDGTLGAAVLRAQYDRDVMGRITEYREFDANGAVTQDRYNITYDYRSAVTSESLSQKKIESGATHTYVTNSVNTYTNGLLMSSTGDLWRDGSDSAIPDTSTTYSYAWYDGAVVSSSSYKPDVNSSTTWTSTYYYDALGRLGSVDIADGRRRTVSFAYSPEGQVLNRKERSAASVNPEDQYLYLNGTQIGFLTSNGNGDPARSDYGMVEYRNVNWSNNPVSAPFRWNTTGGVTDGEFGASGYDYINPAGQGDAPGRYIARSGDSLQSIAAQAWGDASLWYLIASANGMNGSESLVAGQSITIPDRVTNIHNNASTFRVYDPNHALGDLSPTAPKPPKKAGGCGMIGQILMVAIAVAVSIATYGALTGPATGFLGAVAAGAASGAAGSIASQTFGLATGIQSKFDWKGVAMGAISGAVGGGLSSIKGAVGGFLNADKLVSNVAKGALSSALSQGIGVATGLQGKFDWVGVATAGIASGVEGVVSRALPGSGRYDLDLRTGGSLHLQLPPSTLNSALSGAAGTLAGAAARSLFTGTDFGDNIVAALPDVIGSTIGLMAAGALAHHDRVADDDATDPAPPTASPTSGSAAHPFAPGTQLTGIDPAYTTGAPFATVPSSDLAPVLSDHAVEHANSHVADVTFVRTPIQPVGTTDPHLAVKIKIGTLNGGDASVIVNALRLLPRDALVYIRSRGIKFVATRSSVVEYMPELHNTRPRGHETYDSAGRPPLWDFTSGTYNRNKNAVVIGTDGVYTTGSSNFVLHELGHALDWRMGQHGHYVSDGSEFQHVYSNANSASAFHPVNESYYTLASNASGYLSETFAESFAATYAPNSSLLPPSVTPIQNGYSHHGSILNGRPGLQQYWTNKWH
jgi:YD repeat-containing protein